MNGFKYLSQEFVNNVLEFGMKTIKDYHNLHLRFDVLLLADVFEIIRIYN